MAFPEDALAPHEKLVLNLHPHPWILVKPALLMLVPTALGVAAVRNDLHPAIEIVAAALIIVSAGWFLSRFVIWFSRYFVLTSDRVIYRSGVFKRTTIEIPLERINTVLSSQTLAERILRIGDIEIESASAEGSQQFEDLRRPADVCKEIYVQIEDNENRKFDRVRGAVHSPVGGPSIARQIDELAELRAKGHISEDEFQAKKSDLLRRM